MKIAILGGGVEGQSAEKYFAKQPDIEEIKVYNDFTPEDLDAKELNTYDLVFRSPSVSPHKLPKIKNLTTVTKYFFDHCPAPIIGVTGTKGKGTTCSIITSILDSFSKKTHLLGNIGTPAITALSRVKPDDVVIYEMSSFQLWDLEKSPHVAVVLRVEPDHLNVHADYNDYVTAKNNITAHQTAEDYCVYYRQNPDSVKISKSCPGTRIPYPADDAKLDKLIREHLQIPGEHNVENAAAAIATVACFYGQDLETFLRSRNNTAAIKQGLSNFQGLPHRIQLVRELDGVKYYDDNYCTNLAALSVALDAFPEEPLILIAGGISKDADESAIAKRIFDTPNLKKAILIGEMKEALTQHQNPLKYLCADTLDAAVSAAHDIAESYADDNGTAIVLMSPAHASFDMFENATDRGEKFTKLVKKLK